MKKALLVLLLVMSLAGNIQVLDEDIGVNKEIKTELESEQIIVIDVN